MTGTLKDAVRVVLHPASIGEWNDQGEAMEAWKLVVLRVVSDALPHDAVLITTKKIDRPYLIRGVPVHLQEDLGVNIEEAFERWVKVYKDPASAVLRHLTDDQLVLVDCRDCRHFDPENSQCLHPFDGFSTHEDASCALFMRKGRMKEEHHG